MKSLTLFILLALAAPLGWGEDVYYCVEEMSQALIFDDDGTLKRSNYRPERFTLKYIAETNRIALAGGSFPGDGRVLELDCSGCYLSPPVLISAYQSTLHDTIFSMKGNQFVYSFMGFGRSVTTAAGTCTKF